MLCSIYCHSLEPSGVSIFHEAPPPLVTLCDPNKGDDAAAGCNSTPDLHHIGGYCLVASWCSRPGFAVKTAVTVAYVRMQHAEDTYLCSERGSGQALVVVKSLTYVMVCLLFFCDLNLLACCLCVSVCLLLCRQTLS